MPLFAIIGGLIIGVIVYLIITHPNKEDAKVLDQFDRENKDNQRILREFFNKPSTPPVTNIYHIHQSEAKKKDLNTEDIDAEIT